MTFLIGFFLRFRDAFYLGAPACVHLGMRVMPDQSKFISRPATARRWDKSVDTLRRMERAGKLRPYRFGPNSVAYLLRDIEAFEDEALSAKNPLQAVAS